MNFKRKKLPEAIQSLKNNPDERIKGYFTLRVGKALDRKTLFDIKGYCFSTDIELTVEKKRGILSNHYLLCLDGSSHAIAELLERLR